MRLHRYGIQPNMGATGEVTHITVWYENRDDMTGDIMNGNFIASVDDFVRIQNKEIAVEDIIKQKIAKLLDLNADADTELAIQEVREKVDEVNAQAVQAIEAARAEAETKIAEKDLEISALQQMIVELTLMLSMIGQPELPTEPDPEPPEEDPPIEDPPSEPEPTEPIQEEPTDEEPNSEPTDTPTTEIGGEGGE